MTSASKRYYCIDDIIDAGAGRRDSHAAAGADAAGADGRVPLGDATNTTANVQLPMMKRRRETSRSGRGAAAGNRADGSVEDAHPADGQDAGVADDVTLVESLLPCQKISVHSHLALPDVHAFPQRPLASLELLDATSVRDRRLDWCEAFRSAYQRGCRLYVAHPTYAAVFWARRDAAVLARPTPGLKKLLDTLECRYSTTRSAGGRREYLVFRGEAVHRLYDAFLNCLVEGCVHGGKGDHGSCKNDVPRLYCEEPFLHSSVARQTYDRRRGEHIGYFPSWVLEGACETNGRVRSYEKMRDM